MPILAVAFVLSHFERLALYRDGVFRARFDDVDVEYLAKDATFIQLRWMDLGDPARRLLSGLAQVVGDSDADNGPVLLEPISVARGLVGIYDRLPKWTTRTHHLSSGALKIRDLFKRAQDPNRFLFDDIPGTLGAGRSPVADKDVGDLVENVREGLAELAGAYPAMLYRLRDMTLGELDVPDVSPGSLEEIRVRAENVRQLAGDFRLEAFISRLAQFDGSDTCFEGIAGLAANKPPRDWVDSDLDHATIELADMAQRFLRAETYARIQGRPERRQAMAVVIGIDGRPTPLLEVFEVSEPDRATVKDVVDLVAGALGESTMRRRTVILAALAELSARYIRAASPTLRNGKDRGR